MPQKTFNIVVGIVFAAIFLLHGFRFFFGWEAMINGLTVPVWLSLIGALVSGVLAWTAFRFK